MTPPANAPQPDDVARHHLRFGWWTLLIFLTMGLALEAFHGIKAGFYLKVTNETRRLMWTLAHAHGTLLGLVNFGFAMTVWLVPAWAGRARLVASRCLRGATVLMPAGFFLGGLWVYSGDPGLGILLLPIGGAMLLVAVLLTALAARLCRPPTRDSTEKGGTGGRRK